MNQRLGLFRLWAVSAVSWLAAVALYFSNGCFYFHDGSLLRPVCNTGTYQDGVPTTEYLAEFGIKDWVPWLSVALVPPIAMLAIAIGGAWVVAGVRRLDGGQNSN
jgi:hypothetical protein